MHIVITIEDALYEQALEMAEPGIGTSELFSEALSTFVRVQRARRLAELGGTQPDTKDTPRRPEP